MEIRTFRRINAALSQAYGPEAVQVPSLPTIVLAERPLIASHEKALIKRTVLAHGRKKKKKKKRTGTREEGRKEERKEGRKEGRKEKETPVSSPGTGDLVYYLV